MAISNLELDVKRRNLLQMIEAAVSSGAERIKKGELESLTVRIYEGTEHKQAWILDRETK